jgi:hypothetical protein
MNFVFSKMEHLKRDYKSKLEDSKKLKILNSWKEAENGIL